MHTRHVHACEQLAREASAGGGEAVASLSEGANTSNDAGRRAAPAGGDGHELRVTCVGRSGR